MKILGVRLKNLNSLFGEWSIDFTDPAYASDGIFAITGPTGSGKTTILDAICLGLYGRTPRLDRVTKSGNEIMSRQTGECFAEVSFETRKGRFRCHWSQRRARKRSDGELQPARHEVADLTTGMVLESRLTQVGAFIEDATGMDFDRFTRSMMLAQGGFSAFLAASADERAPILEQITGTSVFSDISIAVHERRGSERSALEESESYLKAIQIMSEGEEERLRITLKETEEREKELSELLEWLRKGLQWLRKVGELEGELSGLEERRRAFEERQEEFAPQAARLARSLRALDLEGDYRELLSLKSIQEAELGQRDEALAALPEKEASLAAALLAMTAAEEVLAGVRALRAAEGEVIKKVRDYDARLGEQKRQLDALSRALDLDREKAEAHKMNVARIAGSIENATTGLDEIDRFQAAHAIDAMLPSVLTIIERGFAALKELQARCAEARKDMGEAAGEKKAFMDLAVEAEKAHGELRRRYETCSQESTRLAKELTALLGGREMDWWRGEREELGRRERLLTRVAETLERMDEARRTLHNVTEGITALETERASLSRQIDAHDLEKIGKEKEIAGLETQFALLQRIRDLEEERNHLVDNAPCPLCGSTLHPFAKGDVPEPGETERALSDARAAFKEMAQRVGRLETERARVAEQINYEKKESSLKEESLVKDEEGCVKDLALLDMDASFEGRTERTALGLSAANLRLAEISGIIAAADSKSKEEREARAALESLRREYDSSSTALQAIRLKLQSLDLEEKRLIERGRRLDEEMDAARTGLLADVEPFGIMELPLEYLDAELDDLTRRRDAWQQQVGTRSSLEKSIHDSTAEMDKELALSGSLEKGTVSRQKEREDLWTAYEDLRSLREEQYGTKDPDREERARIAAVEHAEETLDKRRAEHGAHDKEWASFRERARNLTVRVEERSALLSQSEQAFLARVIKAGFSDHAGFLSARLDEEERLALSEREKTLASEKTELEARLADRGAALAVERAKKVTDESPEILAERLNRAEEDLKQSRLDAGGVAARLEENGKGRQRRLEAQKRVDAGKKECARWDDLHQLIGSADGKKFRNFAQGLTFGIMTAHANRRLREMTDRYILIHDPTQPLELSVIDNYQAGEIRSTKNLSGGESFIVSLALALGLSQMASRNVSVDSLFLDEGFGSLDEDALETALETLAGLNATGKLIGIISHVPALKERISTRIRVAPKAGGRSVLSGPGCRREER